LDENAYRARPTTQERRRTFRTITRTKEMVTIREGLSFGHFAGALLMVRLHVCHD
jgi:hypothetical protein